MDNKDLGLKISLSTVKEHLNCPICMGHLSETHVTCCGHRFCKSCIMECINRKPICPCCNANLTPDRIFRDPLYDNLIDDVKKEESEAEKEYFDHMISSATENATNCFLGDQQLRKLFSPVEDVLKAHLKKSLSMHEKFYQDLQKDLKKKHEEVDTDLRLAIQRLKVSRVGSITDSEIEDMKLQGEKRKNSFTDEVHKCSRLVAEAYDKYLTEHIPPLSVLPVTVTVSLLKKSLQFHGIRLKPNDSVADIKNIICELVKKKHGENIFSFEDDVRFLCFSPLVKRSLYEMTEISKDIIEQEAANSDVIVLPGDCLPVLQFAIKPDSEIVIYGTVRCESDLPKVCFASTFQQTEKKPMDYFKCKNCNVNWICRPCIDVCHRDHDVTLYIEKHQPTWACCYCGKTKKCVIQT